MRGLSSLLIGSVAFFYLLPWVKISALGIGFDFSGIDLILGNEIVTQIGSQEIKEKFFEGELFVAIPLVVALLGAGYSLWRSNGNVQIALGVLGVLFLIAINAGIENVVKEKGKGMVQTSYLSGYWLSFLAFVAVAGWQFAHRPGFPNVGIYWGLKPVTSGTQTDTNVDTAAKMETQERPLLPEGTPQTSAAKPIPETWEATFSLIKGVIAVVGLLVLHVLVNILPGMAARLVGRVSIGQLLQLLISAGMIWIVANRINTLSTFLAHYGGPLLERLRILQTVEHSVLPSLYWNLSLLIATLVSWFVIALNLGTLNRLIGDWVAIASTLLFLIGIGLIALRVYRLLEPVIAQVVKDKTGAHKEG